MKNIQVIPLNEAAFCVDCCCFTNSKGSECENCRSQALLAMAPVMGRKRETDYEKVGVN
jgi:hypothetical protein